MRKTKNRKKNKKTEGKDLPLAQGVGPPGPAHKGGQGRLLPPARRTPPTAEACTPRRPVLLATRAYPRRWTRPEAPRPFFPLSQFTPLPLSPFSAQARDL